MKDRTTTDTTTIVLGSILVQNSDEAFLLSRVHGHKPVEFSRVPYHQPECNLVPVLHTRKDSATKTCTLAASKFIQKLYTSILKH